MDRRRFLHLGACATLNSALASGTDHDVIGGKNQAPSFSTRNARWQAAYDKALSILAGNVRVLPRVGNEVLIEGAQYRGIWLECAPHESLVYRRFNPKVARDTQMAFFRLQKPDGQLPAWIRETREGFAQIQMVVPIAATAWELAQATHDSELLETAYRACSAWDHWLMHYRNTRGSGLIEGFCTFDTGHDNSPRWRGVPNQCPDNDARKVPHNVSVPRLCPDLSATVFGGRVALAEMASALGKHDEEGRWREEAEKISSLILEKLFVPEDGAFYDLDAQNHFVRIRSDVISRVCGEHVCDQITFDSVWQKQLHNQHAFWAPYPFPSIAMDDPTYDGDVPQNSWGGPSQALTALRTCRWMDHYQRSAEHGLLMDRWCEAIQRDMTFRQQIDPKTGVFAPEDQPGYSPCSLTMYEFTWRLAGIVEQRSELWWNVRPGHAAAQESQFTLSTNDGRRAELRYEGTGAELQLSGKHIATVRHGTARVVTSREGRPRYALGTDQKAQAVEIEIPGGVHRTITLKPNERVTL